MKIAPERSRPSLLLSVIKRYNVEIDKMKTTTKVFSIVGIGIYLLSFNVVFAAPVLVQEVISGNGGTPRPVNIAAPVDGNTLVVIVGLANSAATVTSVTGGGVTWVQAAYQSNTNATISIWYGLNASGGGTTVTVNFSAGNAAINFMEFSGIVSVETAEDGTEVLNTGNTTTLMPTTGNYITTNANDVLIAGLKTSSTAYSSGPTNSFNRLTAASTSQEGAYRIVSATGTYSTDWVWSTTNRNWSTAMIALKAATASVDNLVHGKIRGKIVIRGRVKFR